MTTIMDFGIPDRIGKHDWYWGETITRWQQEGLPEIDYIGDDLLTDRGRDAQDRFEVSGDSPGELESRGTGAPSIGAHVRKQFSRK